MAIILLMNLSFAIWGYLSSGQRMRKLEKWIESRLKPAEWKRTIILMSGMLWVNFFYLYLPTIVELEVINRVTGGIFSKTYSTGLLIFFISVLNLIALLTMQTVTNDQQGNFWKDFYKLGSSYLSRMMIVTYLGIVVMTVIIHNLRKVF